MKTSSWLFALAITANAAAAAGTMAPRTVVMDKHFKWNLDLHPSWTICNIHYLVRAVIELISSSRNVDEHPVSLMQCRVHIHQSTSTPLVR